METIPTRRSILYQLEDVSAELKEKPLVGEIIELREEADRLLDLYIDLGLQSTKRLGVPPQGYESEYDSDWEY